MKKELLAVAMLLFAGGNLLAQPHVNDGTSYLMNQPLDMSTDFRDLSNTLFFADHLESFDAKSGEGAGELETRASDAPSSLQYQRCTAPENENARFSFHCL